MKRRFVLLLAFISLTFLLFACNRIDYNSQVDDIGSTESTLHETLITESTENKSDSDSITYVSETVSFQNSDNDYMPSTEVKATDIVTTENAVNNSTVKADDYSDEWGLLFTFYPESGNKGKIVFSQNSTIGKPKGTLMTGAAYTIQKKQNNEWKDVPTITDAPVQWKGVAYQIPMDDSFVMDINYEYIYGELSEGEYRICKNVDDYIEPGNQTQKTYYYNFEVK